MENIVLVIHLILALAIIGLVLIQRSEGGGLGIGGGSGGLSNLASAGGTANALTKMTAFFAACFFCTSLTLAILAGAHHTDRGILETFAAEEAAATTGETTRDISEDAIVEDGALPDEATGEAAPTEQSEETPQRPTVPLGE